MRLIAVHQIWFAAGPIAPGAPFRTSEDEGMRLIALGAAVPDESPAPPERIPPQPPPAKGKR